MRSGRWGRVGGEGEGRKESQQLQMCQLPSIKHQFLSGGGCLMTILLVRDAEVILLQDQSTGSCHLLKQMLGPSGSAPFTQTWQQLCKVTMVFHITFPVRTFSLEMPGIEHAPFGHAMQKD